MYNLNKTHILAHIPNSERDLDSWCMEVDIPQKQSDLLEVMLNNHLQTLMPRQIKKDGKHRPFCKLANSIISKPLKDDSFQGVRG